MSDAQFTILAADDELSIHRLVQAALDGRGYNLVEAHNGDEALEKALLDRPDMVILDVMMPGLNGWELTRYFRSKPEFKEMGILILTGIGESLNDMTSPLYGADAHLDKPFELDDLVSKVEEVVALVRSRQADSEETAEA
mgnify:CR=1 FL=1